MAKVKHEAYGKSYWEEAGAAFDYLMAEPLRSLKQRHVLLGSIVSDTYTWDALDDRSRPYHVEATRRRLRLPVGSVVLENILTLANHVGDTVGLTSISVDLRRQLIRRVAVHMVAAGIHHDGDTPFSLFDRARQDKKWSQLAVTDTHRELLYRELHNGVHIKAAELRDYGLPDVEHS